jgi:glutamine synthetase
LIEDRIVRSIKAEYIWIDGCNPWGLRSKVRVLKLLDEDFSNILDGSLDNIPEWGFDGSSTEQATGNDSDCLLKPVKVVYDSVRCDGSSVMVLCEVLDGESQHHKTNNRWSLSQVSQLCESHNPFFGIEQEYTIIKCQRPLGFPPSGYPSPQGKYYCSAGGDRAYGRDISDDHLDACIESGLDITGTNAEVMPGQWEYQIGGPGVGPVEASDQLWISRWILLKIAERRGMTVTFEPKPMLGDWNGAGCHTNFSTERMRAPGGIRHIEQACKKMSNNIQSHLDSYGDGIEFRLTGMHETCSYKDFKWGVADRTASIRIPIGVANDGCGYLEDRRPNANCDPYLVCKVILESTCFD